MKPSIYLVDIDRPTTWTRYRNGLCNNCVANCCTMPVEVKLPDLVRLQLVDPFEAEHEAPKQIAKRLTKAGLIEHFNFKYEIFTLARRASGDCNFLDATTRRCTVYEQRPNTCRKHPQISPRPGYCPYRGKDSTPKA
jgi:Fe-S-cluster containining protein